jgi:hypothetical protein
MDADDGSLLLVLSGNTHFGGSSSRVAITFPGWNAMAAAMSSPSTCVPSSLATAPPPPGNLQGLSRDRWPGWPQL